MEGQPGSALGYHKKTPGGVTWTASTALGTRVTREGVTDPSSRSVSVGRGPVRTPGNRLSEGKAFRTLPRSSTVLRVVILILVFILVFNIPLATEGISEKQR